MAVRRTANVLYVLLALLIIDALFEMSFIVATVSFLHTRAGRSFQVAYGGGQFPLHGKPEHLVLDQGHTSNGAAGTALILVGIGGFLTFPFLRRDARTGRQTMYSRVMAMFWLIISVLSVLLTLAALIYTMHETSVDAGQEIDVALAATLHNRAYPNFVAYPFGYWTPQNWFSAVLQLDLVDSGDRSTISQKLNVMQGWRWNLIPLFILGVAAAVVGVMEIREQRAMMMQTTFPKKSHDLESSEVGHAGIPTLKSITRKPVPQQITPLSPYQPYPNEIPR